MTSLPVPQFDALASLVGWKFRDPELLALSMAHRSWSAERETQSNERLEFLGDAVLGLIVTNFIYNTYPELPEGHLAKLRASVVNSIVLADVARELHLGDSLLLGKGENSTGGREKSSILADAVEAVIGAIYLDGGWEPAELFVMRTLGERITAYSVGPGGDDYKTRLQELVARRFSQMPVYRVSGTGPDHEKEFEAAVFIAGVERGAGVGRSKKLAEQRAAQMAWESLNGELNVEP
jgi:ribonuclease III